MSTKSRGMDLSAEAFVRLWQSSENLEELSKKSGISRQSLSTRAHHYRKKGVPLKNFSTGSGKRQDWKALAKLAESLNGHKED